MVLEIIQQEFEKRTKKNNAYSLRAFARSLDINSSTLSSLLNRKRKLSFKTAQSLLDKLEMSDLERKDLLFRSQRPDSNIAANERKLAEEHLQIISGWEHYAILSLIETVDFRSSVKFISAKLNLPTSAVIAALARLESVGLIRKSNGAFFLCQEAVGTTRDVPSSALRKANRDYIERALYSLDQHPPLDRHISGVTLAIQKSKLPKANQLIREFKKSLGELLESGNKEEVYRLNIQLFPLKK